MIKEWRQNGMTYAKNKEIHKDDHPIVKSIKGMAIGLEGSVNEVTVFRTSVEDYTTVPVGGRRCIVMAVYLDETPVHFHNKSPKVREQVSLCMRSIRREKLLVDDPSKVTCHACLDMLTESASQE